MYFAFQRGERGRIPVTFAERPYRTGASSAKDIIWTTLCKVPDGMEHMSCDELAKWYMQTKEAK